MTHLFDTITMLASPTDDDRQDLLLSCRFGDLADVQEFVSKFSPDALDGIQDDNGNTLLHMAAGNGHTGEHTVPPTPSLPHIRHWTDVP